MALSGRSPASALVRAIPIPCNLKEPAPSGRKSGSRQSYRANYVRDPFSKIWLPRARGFSVRVTRSGTGSSTARLI